MRLVFDIETNGFLESMDVVHSLCIQDLDSGNDWSCHGDNPGAPTALTLIDGLTKLMEADLVIGHNIIKFDIPAIQKVYPWFKIADEKIFDTLVASRLIWTNLLNDDLQKIRAQKVDLTMKMAGSHSLEAWGRRLGHWKGDYSDMMKAKGLDPWVSWNPEMQEYCEQDVHVNTELFNLIQRKQCSEEAMKLEHDVAIIMAQVERNGYAFNVAKAEDLYRELAGQRAEMAKSLRTVFPPWEAPNGKPFVPKRDNAKLGYKKGVAVQKMKTVVFNPNSRDQIADRLSTIYGWVPTEKTPKGKPKVDETILEELPYPEAEKLAEYMMIQKIIGMLAEGKNAWLKLERNGRIHGSIITNGAVTGRATHSNPNVGQVPSVAKPLGGKCRELFGKPYQLGCDVSGLELRMLGHFMAAHDSGEYAKEVIEGDIHTVNQLAAGLPTRDMAKTFIYGFLYGAGNAKIGSIVGKGPQVGGKLRKAFLAKVPALKKLQEGVKGKAEQCGELKGLDGRRLHIRSPHASLNTLLQSAGALVCKRWIVEFVKLLKENDYYQTDVKIVAWVHDELQMEVADHLVEGDSSVVGDLCIQAIERAGEHFKIRCPLTGEYKIGDNWKDCH